MEQHNPQSDSADGQGSEGASGLKHELAGLAARQVSRRTVLFGGAAMATAAWLRNLSKTGVIHTIANSTSSSGAGSSNTATDASAAQAQSSSNPSFSVNLRRPEDLLHLDFDFYNLQVVSSNAGPSLALIDTSKPGTIVVTFPPQHLFEQAFAETANPPTNGSKGEAGDDFNGPPSGLNLTAAQIKYYNEHYTNPPNSTPAPAPVDARLAGRSRLAFSLTPSLLPMPYDVAHLLDWHNWSPIVVPVAQDVGDIQNNTLPALVEPSATQTAIELPWHLVLSPGNFERWTNTPTPITLNGRTELFTATLMPSVFGPIDITAPPRRPYVRGVWTYDATAPTNSKAPKDDQTYPFKLPTMTPLDRYDIVQNSSVSRIGTSAYRAVPADVERLSLSALGGFLDVRGQWDNPFATSLIEWKNQATMGRDHYVRIVRKGFLFPFGHPCTLVKITERKFQKAANSNATVAYLRQRIFLVVRQADKRFGVNAFHQPDDGRDFPFAAMSCTTHTTPILDSRPDTRTDENISGQPKLFKAPLNSDGHDAWIPQVNGHNFRFHFVGTDQRGAPVEFTSPCIYVDELAAFDIDKMQALRGAYDNLAPTDYGSLRNGHINGGRVHFAPSATEGDTAHHVSTMVWGARGVAIDPSTGQAYTTAQLHNADQPRFYPNLDHAQVRLAAADAISAKQTSPTHGVGYHQHYVDKGFDSANPGLIYLVPTNGNPGVKIPPSRSGGVATPNIAITAFSRKTGPVGGDVTQAQADRFDATTFFDGADAKILGSINLKDVVLPGPLAVAPTITSTTRGTTSTTLLHFEPTLIPDTSAPDGSAYFEPGGNASLVIDARIVTDQTDASKSVTTIDGDLLDFTLHLIGSGDTEFISVHFSRLRFHSETGQKSTSEPNVDDVAFQGALAFIEDLKNYIPFGDSPPAIEVSNADVTATVEVAIPSISLGVFMLENLAFSGSVLIPFDDRKVALTFAFCSRENPFHLSIAFFGGGGWFAITLDPAGVQSFEVGLEFGAQAGIDLGVASGEVHIWAGIYFQMGGLDGGGESATIEGYIRAGGSVEVLYIASVSLEAYLGFTYASHDGTTKVGGEASLTLTISILCFSIDVSADFQQYFGGEGDPYFDALMPPETEGGSTSTFFNEYCRAFAPTTIDVTG